MFAVIIIAGLVAFSCQKWYNHAEKKHTASKEEGEFAAEDDGLSPPVFFGVISAVVGISYTAAFIYHAICLSNVKYYAFKDLIKTISTMVP